MSTIQDWGREVIENEYKAIVALRNYIDDDFEKVVNTIHQNKGRVIVTGVGKSAIIAEKIVATLNSTGTPAIFMHAADAIHGDLGIIQSDDLVICLSKSGSTPEIKVLIPLIRNMGNTIVALVSNSDSYLAQQADFVLKAYVSKEACPNNLAPTSSTTAQLVIGDALAICLLRLKGFTEKDFARVHPGGALGKKLYLRVSDIISKNIPSVKTTDDIQSVIIEISSKMLGATAVLDKNELKGIITDGDLRRMLEKNVDYSNLKAIDIMSANPKTVEYSDSAIQAFNLMEEYSISQLLAMDNGQYMGMVHIHDILREGII